MRKAMSFGVGVCALIGFAAVAGAATSTAYQGNGATGFGGPIGNGTLTISDNGGGVINFSLSTGVPFTSNALVLYIDSQPGGVNNTSTFTDTGTPPGSDGGRTAISGYNPTNTPPTRTLVNFPAGFGADFGISVEPGSFAGLFDLSNPANFNFVSSGNLAGSGSGPFTFSFTRAQLGLGATDPFSFVGTLISTTAYRSNETIGASATTPGTTNDSPNAGFTGTQTFSAADRFSVPEPSTLAALGLLGVTLLAKRRR